MKWIKLNFIIMIIGMLWAMYLLYCLSQILDHQYQSLISTLLGL